jgi:formylglycine-generating enzyme required for sulfatase activity
MMNPSPCRRSLYFVPAAARVGVAALVVMLLNACSERSLETVVPATLSKVVPAEAPAAYETTVPESKVSFSMLPIPAGSFHMGCDSEEAGAAAGESPSHEVQVSGFWMGAHEVTWDEYQLYQLDGVANVDGVTGPTPPYVPMNFGMPVEGHPAISMTQYAARQYCKWLSIKTGHFYRLPTEAEWEYACRAGSTTPYSFASDSEALAEYAWYFDNSNDSYHPVGLKKPNGFGLFDMHGNVSEWVLDGFNAELYAARATAGDVAEDPLLWANTEYGRVVRGGSWDDDPELLRSAARRVSNEDWKQDDPQMPQSIWYLTSARFVGFRIVRPYDEPSPQEQQRYWESLIPEILEIQERQRRGER